AGDPGLEREARARLSQGVHRRPRDGRHRVAREEGLEGLLRVRGLAQRRDRQSASRGAVHVSGPRVWRGGNARRAARGRGWGRRDVIETAGYKQAKAEIKRLNDELEQRVVERTGELVVVNEELRKEMLERQRAEERAEAERERLREARADLAHISRVTAMGEL